MANDKDFVVNGPVVVGKDTKVTVGSIAAGTVDLSTGNYFTDTPTGDYTYTFANPGDVQAFQIEATGGSATVAQAFSTTLYTGTEASTQTITNGIDLAGEGGLVWAKARDGAINHVLMDSEQGVGKFLNSNQNYAQQTNSDGMKSFNSNGFTFGNQTGVGWSNDHVYWTFRKAPKFFDVVTYSGNSVNGRAIPHNLGCEVGMLIVKPISSAGDWWVYHRKSNTSNPGTAGGKLHETVGWDDPTDRWNSTAPTSTHFYLAGGAEVNGSGKDYVAYLFAHDTDASSIIKCGSYTGNSGGAINVELGFEPQWLMVKNASSSSNWVVLDVMRGFSWDAGNNLVLNANADYAEQDVDENGAPRPTPTGFSLASSNQYGEYNSGSDTYIYMAIRAAAAPAITWPTNIEWAGGVTPSTPAEGETDVYTFTTDDGGTTYTGIQSIDNAS
jgi:hypothetical protein